MTAYSQGDVVLVQFPFTDLSTIKQRPAVVISANWYNQLRNDCVLLAITSIIPSDLDQDHFLLSPSDVTSGGLLKPSVVKLGKIVTIEQQLIKRSLGRLSPATLDAILDGVKNVLGS